MRIDEVATPISDDLPFNIVDDLHVFMMNDPMFYRKQYYPTMCTMSDHPKRCQGKGLKKLLMPMIDKAADSYCKKFDLGRDSAKIIKLQDRLDLAKKIASDEMPRIRNGEYK